MQRREVQKRTAQDGPCPPKLPIFVASVGFGYGVMGWDEETSWYEGSRSPFLVACGRWQSGVDDLPMHAAARRDGGAAAVSVYDDVTRSSRLAVGAAARSGGVEAQGKRRVAGVSGAVVRRRLYSPSVKAVSGFATQRGERPRCGVVASTRAELNREKACSVY